MDKTKKNNRNNKENKKKLMMSRRKIRRIAGIVCLGVLVLAIAAYIFFDSRSYVASVEGNRIMTYEYKFLLKQQIITTEKNEGLTDKTAAEKEKYWTSTESGQNPLEAAKNESLSASKEYVIQLIKAYQMGLKVNSSVTGEVDQYLKSIQGDMTDTAFASYVLDQTGVSLNQFKKILENTNLIDKFKTDYIKNNYTPVTVTDDQAKAEYDTNPKSYDSVDFSYVIFSKKDSSGALLAQDALATQKSIADEALKQIDAGGDISSIFSTYTGSSQGFFGESTPGKATVSYTTAYPEYQPLFDYLFNNTAGSSSVVETDSYIFAVKIDKHTSFEDLKASLKTFLENKNESDWYKNEIRQWSIDPQYNIIKNDSVYDSDSIIKGLVPIS